MGNRRTGTGLWVPLAAILCAALLAGQTLRAPTAPCAHSLHQWRLPEGELL